MRKRAKRFGIAVLLTALDFAVFDEYVGVIWQTELSLEAPPISRESRGDSGV